MLTWENPWKPAGKQAGNRTNTNSSCWYLPNSPTSFSITSKSIPLQGPAEKQLFFWFILFDISLWPCYSFQVAFDPWNFSKNGSIFARCSGLSHENFLPVFRLSGVPKISGERIIVVRARLQNGYLIRVVNEDVVDQSPTARQYLTARTVWHAVGKSRQYITWFFDIYKHDPNHVAKSINRRI